MSNKKPSQEEVARRLADRGYELKGEYLGSNIRVLVRCPVHEFEKDVFFKNAMKGMVCCFAERQREKMAGNQLTAGSKLSDEHREKIGASQRGRKLSAEHIEKSRAGRTGLKRSSEFSARQGEWLREAVSKIETIIHRAATGKTAGRPGIFYIARVGDFLKFGSTNRTIDYRISRLRTSDGEAELLLSARVDDAGAYEAAMMLAHRQHWSHGEYFHPSVLAP